MAATNSIRESGAGENSRHRPSLDFNSPTRAEVLRRLLELHDAPPRRRFARLRRFFHLIPSATPVEGDT